MKILITGGAGFVGSNLIDRLLPENHQILVIDNFSTGRRDNLKPHKNLKIIENTIANKDFLWKTFDKFRPHQVVHAAASYKDPNNWEEDSRTNVTGSALIAQACLEFEVKRLIYFQTALCYGVKPLEQPITLNHPLRPWDSSYALTKTAGEQYIALSGQEFISFRLANAYGPRNLSGPLPTFYHRLSEKKECFVVDTRRDFIYINDLIDIVIQALDGKGKKGYYHVSSGSDYAIKELFEAVVAAMDIKLKKEVEVRPRSPEDAPTILLDPTKTHQDFNWKITTPLKTGVKAAVGWYKTHGVTQTFTHLTSPRTD